jgi:hypothetical protein
LPLVSVTHMILWVGTFRTIRLNLWPKSKSETIWRVQKQFSHQLANRALIWPRLCLSANRQRSRFVLNAYADVAPIYDKGTLPFALKTLKQVLTWRSKLHPLSDQPKPRS